MPVYHSIPHIEPTLHTLPNGLRHLHWHYPSSPVLHATAILKVGSRDESPERNGAAHLLEHCIFRGSANFSSSKLNDLVEGVGGMVDAFTTRDFTQYSCTLPLDKFKRAYRFLSELVFLPKLTEQDIAKEKTIIHEEISMYHDLPEEDIFDTFLEQAYQPHALSHNILGTHETLDAIAPDDLKAFHQSAYQPQNFMFCTAGGLSAAEAHKAFDYFFAAHAFTAPPLPPRERPVRFDTTTSAHPKPIHQTHVVWGNVAPIKYGEDYFALRVLQHILSDAGTNAALNLALRERNALTYAAYSMYQAFEDTGCFSIYYATDPAQMAKCDKLVAKELQNLISKPLSSNGFSRIVDQMLGRLVCVSDQLPSVISTQGKNFLTQGRIIPLPYIVDSIKAITPTQIQEVAAKYLSPENFGKTIYHPADSKKR